MTLEDKRRHRRRRRRALAIIAFLAVALGLGWFFESQATTTVIFVRYADLEPGTDPNRGLSAAGLARARELSRVLGDVDVVAGVDAIFATQYRRSQETADPLSKRLQVPLQIVDSANVIGLTEMILKEYKGKIVLVVTDREALPQLIRELQGSKKVPPIADREHDNLYVVSIPWYGKVKTLRLRYGEPFVPAGS
jgi:broad specificity phosphatase PhoE